MAFKREYTQKHTMDIVRASSKANLGYTGKWERLDVEDLIDLVMKAKTCRKAMNEVVFALFPYIQRAAYRGAKSNVSVAVNEEDLFQSAYFGLAKAVEKYDPKMLNENGKSMSFTTYFTHWLKQSISREASNTGNLVRIPVHVKQMKNTITRNYKEYCSDLGIQEQSIARLDPKFLQQFAREPHNSISGITVLQEWMNACELSVSLDGPISNSDDNTDSMYELVGGEISTEDEVIKTSESEDMYHKLMMLPQRKRLIIFMRFGMGPFESLTLDEIGKLIGLTRERVRQIESISLRILKGRFYREKTNDTFKHSSIGNSKSDIISSDILARLTPEQIEYLLTEDEAQALYKTVDGFEPNLDDEPEEGTTHEK